MSPQLNPESIVGSGLCIGCGACVGKSNQSKVEMRMDQDGFLKPMGPVEWMHSGVDGFERICPFSPEAANEDQLSSELFQGMKEDHHIGRYTDAYVGHAIEGNYRIQGSSGGMVTWVAAELLKQGLIDGVAHVTSMDDPTKEAKFFGYTISRTHDDLVRGAKSRYYPIELSKILHTIREMPGRYAIVGIPCFIKAIQLLRREDILFKERIVFTLGLFCGHMKSARFVESFAWQMNVKIAEVNAVDFRLKNPERPANWYRAKLTLNNGQVAEKDWWHLKDGDWGAGFFMNSPCNFCDDVVAETADISFGDAWIEPYSSDGKGTNVVVVRSPKIHHIIQCAIQDGKLSLENVNHEFVKKTQEAGFRQRREGLAYRLSWKRIGIKPKKRFDSKEASLSIKRKIVYRLRSFISSASHRIFRLAFKINKPQLYIQWAGGILALYQAIVYQRGRFGKILKHLLKS